MSLNRDGLQGIRSASKASHSVGMLLAVLGVFAVLMPLFTGITVSLMMAILLVIAGLVLGMVAFQSETMGKGLLRFLFGGLSFITAVLIFVSPEKGLGFLTAVLTAYLFLGGLVDLLLSARAPVGEGKGWLLLNGIISLSLGLLIIFQWPASGAWAVGLYLGVRLLLFGMMLIGIGNRGKAELTQLQDERIAELEQQVQSSAQALEDHATALADLKKQRGQSG